VGGKEINRDEPYKATLSRANFIFDLLQKEEQEAKQKKTIY
jgi:hypothetical protein